MALLKNCEVHHVKCDPERPSGRFSKTNPRWELQMRTSDPAQREEWAANGLKPKLIVGKAGTEEEGVAVLTADGKKQWRVNLSKKSKNRKGEAAPPVEVVNGAREPINPNTIGNGSICNVRIYPYDFTNADGEKAQAAVLMGIQVTKHKVFNRPVHDDEFGMEDTETIIDDDVPVVNPAPSAPAAPSPQLADKREPSQF